MTLPDTCPSCGHGWDVKALQTPVMCDGDGCLYVVPEVRL